MVKNSNDPIREWRFYRGEGMVRQEGGKMKGKGRKEKNLYGDLHFFFIRTSKKKVKLDYLKI